MNVLRILFINVDQFSKAALERHINTHQHICVYIYTYIMLLKLIYVSNDFENDFDRTLIKSRYA